MRFGILGPLTVADDRGREVGVGGPKQQAVLAILLVRPNEVVSQDRLVEELWSGRAPASAVTSLHAHVSRLRRALGDDQRIVTTAGGYTLRVGPGELDGDRFEGLVAEGRTAISTAAWEVAAEKLREALALWRGPPLSDFQYDSFAQAEISRLSELYVGALEQRVEAELALGHEMEAIGDLERLVREHPFRERLRGQLMLALYRTGRQADALAAYRSARAALVDELGIEPSAQLRELHEAILAQAPSLLRSMPTSQLESHDTVDVRDPAPSRPHEEAEASREERKVVTFLAASVAFREMAEPRDPEDVRQLLGPFHAHVRTVVERFGGVLEKILGAEVIALFGAPTAHEDDPERAVRSALAVRDWVAEQQGLELQIAVDTGEVLIAARGEPTEATAVGDVVNIAAQLRDGAAPNTVLVGERTYRATRDAIEYHAANHVAARGRPQPMRAWEAVRTRLDTLSLAQASTPFLGRVRELDLLISLLARGRDEHACQLVTLVGVPGIGKSRLVQELQETAAREPEVVAWRQGRSLPYGEGVTFWALGEMVKQQAEILGSDSADDAIKKLERTVHALVDVDADWIAAQLRPLVGLAPEQDVGAQGGDVSAAWRRFFAALADRRPTVLVFEDLHWADDGLLDFIDQLVDRAAGRPLLVIATARPELLDRRPDWGGGKPNAVVLSLPPLIEDDARRLVASLLSTPSVDAAMLAELVGRAGGNPLYVEQYARALLERGALEQLPDTIQGIIAARLDALPHDAKLLLQNAAVVGRVFWLGALEAVDGCPRSRAEEMLYGLARQEFVRPALHSSVSGEPEYAFSHILLRDVAYGQIPRAARSVKHERVATWIESLGHHEDHAELLAHHYIDALEFARAGARDDPKLISRARIALRAAGDRALALASYPAATSFYNAALELWPDTDPDRVWLLVGAGRAQFGSDRTGTHLLAVAVEELESRADAEGAAEVAVELAGYLWIAGDSDGASAHIDRALDLTRARKRSRARAYALVERAAYHMHAGEHGQAIRVVRDALPLTTDLGIDELRARALDILGGCRVLCGDVQGVEDSERAIALAREKNAFSRLVRAELNHLCDYFFLGQLAASWDTLRAARLDVESYGAAEQRHWLRVAQAEEAFLNGRWDDTERIVNELIAEMDAGAANYYLDPACLELRACISLGRGELEAASADSERALEPARRIKDPQILAPALVIRGMVMLAQDRRDEASGLAREILAGSPALLIGLMELHPPATPIELAWLLRDLNTEAELARVLAVTPSNPWLEAAAAITNGDFANATAVVAAIGAPSLEAYTQLHAAKEMIAIGQPSGANALLESALAFYRPIGATRYSQDAEAALALANDTRVPTPGDR
ncbi:MAG TPA: BTAD domain-containing putative transcriptional regulator [Solirubrobacteraceae bacterium]